MFPDGIGGLASWAEVGPAKQARPIVTAAVNRARELGDLMIFKKVSLSRRV